jgi:hypothetical protein
MLDTGCAQLVGFTYQPPASRSMAKKLLKLTFKIVAAITAGTVVMLVPLPVSDPVVTARTAIVSFVIVVYIGKTIYDTLFYDRYIP